MALKMHSKAYSIITWLLDASMLEGERSKQKPQEDINREEETARPKTLRLRVK